MAWFNFGRKSVEQTIRTPKELENFLLSIVRSSHSGINVTPETAMECASVAACVRLLGSSMAQVPAAIYKKLPNGAQELAKDHPNYNLVAHKPNSYQTSSQFRRTMQRNLCLWGNAYARPVRIRNRILELHPIHPSSVTVKQHDDYSIEYHVKNLDGSTSVETDIFHLKDFASNSYVGDSRVIQAKQAIGLSIAAEKFGALFFKNGAKSAGAWKVPGTLSEEAYERLQASLNLTATGDNSHENPLLEEGLEWQATGFNARDSQLTELRDLQTVEIARVWNVPPHMIQHLKNATFSNIEHQGREYVQTGLKPWACEWQDQLNNYVLTDSERDTYFVDLDIDSFSRGDLAARTNFYNAGVQWGYLSPNEVRRAEKMPDRDEGDRYLRPVNMVYTDEEISNETEN